MKLALLENFLVARHLFARVDPRAYLGARLFVKFLAVDWAQQACDDVHESESETLSVVRGAFDSVSHAKLDQVHVFEVVVLKRTQAPLLVHEPDDRQHPSLGVVPKHLIEEISEVVACLNYPFATDVSSVLQNRVALERVFRHVLDFGPVWCW